MQATKTYVRTISTSHATRKACLGGLISTAEIISIASECAGRRGYSLETLAGIGWVQLEDGNEVPERNWAEGEQLETALDVLREDGHAYEIFPNTPAGLREYYSRAAELGLDEQVADHLIDDLEPDQRASHVAGLIKNLGPLLEFFKGESSCDYYDGTSYQLYLDLNDNTLNIHHEVSNNTWTQRDDGSYILIRQVSGYADTPADQRYHDGCDINDFGYTDWLDQVRGQIEAALRERADQRA